MARNATKTENDQEEEYENEADLDDEDQDDEDQGDEQDGEQDGESEGSDGVMSSLMSQFGQHKGLLAPVATSAAAAAATYAAKKLPDLLHSLEDGGGDKLRGKLDDAKDSGGAKGFAAGAVSRAMSGSGGSLFDRLKQGGEDEATEQAKDSGGVTGAAAKVADKVGGSGSQGGYGWGKGRRLPILRSIDVAAPLDVVYGQYTQFEELSSFMHRVEAVDQEDDANLTWHQNVWGRRRHWKVKIIEQVPNERIAWEIKGGGQGKGVITFHKLAPKLTRVELIFDWQPRGIIEKIGSGLRVHKRATKTDLYRFKAFVETRGEATGTWPGEIEDGEAKGETRNKRNRKADPIPTEAQQHSESDEKKAREKGGGDEDGDSNGKGSEDDGKDAAREERKRHREERAKKS